MKISARTRSKARWSRFTKAPPRPMSGLRSLQAALSPLDHQRSDRRAEAQDRRCRYRRHQSLRCHDRNRLVIHHEAHDRCHSGLHICCGGARAGTGRLRQIQMAAGPRSTLLTSGKAIAVVSGSSLKSSLPVAVTVSLVPFADAKLPTAPERAPRLPTSFAGFLQIGAPGHDGTYKISLSSEAWIDVVQGGHLLKSVAFSGATGCAGIRKSVKFDLKAKPFTIQLSNVATNSIGVAISGD